MSYPEGYRISCYHLSQSDPVTKAVIMPIQFSSNLLCMESDPQQWPIVKAYPKMWSTWCCIQRSHIMTTHHILTPNHCHHVYPSYESFCHQNPISCWCHLYHSLGCSNPSETDLLPLGKDKGDQGIFVQYHKFKGGQRGNCVRSCKLTHYSLWCREGNHNPSLVSHYVLCSAASWT